MQRKKLKIGLAVVTYSLIIVLIFLGGLVFLSKTFKQESKNVLPETLYEFKGNSMVVKDETTTKINREDLNNVNKKELIAVDDIYKEYNNILNSNLIIIMVLACILVIPLTLLLWLILRKIEQNNMLIIAKELSKIEDEQEIQNLDPILSEVYKELKDKFNNQMDDYKRLNSYLSHEQKNDIAMLKSKLELENNIELISDINRVNKSIEDVLTISSIGNREMLSEIDLAIICARVCDEYKKINQKIVFDFDEEANTSILGKERWVYRAIANLVDNAFKYGNNKDVYVYVGNKRGNVIVEIKDNGVGMSEESKRKIFDNGFRVNELKKDGYGIGLSLVKHVCDLCNGFIWVESSLNEGSTFYLSFNEC